MELLARLLGGTERVKILRYFLHHDEDIVETAFVANKLKIKTPLARKEMQSLLVAGFLEKKKTKMTITVQGDRKITAKSKEYIGWKLNTEFPHNEALRALIFDFDSIDKRELASRFKHVGRIKLFVVSGLFVGSETARLDLLIVGEAIKRNQAEKALDLLSAELGREVVYSVMDVEEFEYRRKMYDKFIRDIFEGPHEVVIDKLRKTTAE